MHIFVKSIWVLLSLVFAFLSGAYFFLGKSTHTYKRFAYYQENFIIGGVSLILILLIVAIVTVFIWKRLNRENLFKTTLIIVNITILIFGIQAFFLKEKVDMQKYNAIYWEDNKGQLLAEIKTQILQEEKPSTSSAAAEVAECMVEQIESDEELFKQLVQENNMFNYLNSNTYYTAFYKACTN